MDRPVVGGLFLFEAVPVDLGEGQKWRATSPAFPAVEAYGEQPMEAAIHLNRSIREQWENFRKYS